MSFGMLNEPSDQGCDVKPVLSSIGPNSIGVDVAPADCDPPKSLLFAMLGCGLLVGPYMLVL